MRLTSVLFFVMTSSNHRSKDNSNRNNRGECALRMKMLTLHPFQGVANRG